MNNKKNGKIKTFIKKHKKAIIATGVIAATTGGVVIVRVLTKNKVNVEIPTSGKHSMSYDPEDMDIFTKIASFLDGHELGFNENVIWDVDANTALEDVTAFLNGIEEGRNVSIVVQELVD